MAPSLLRTDYRVAVLSVLVVPYLCSLGCGATNVFGENGNSSTWPSSSGTSSSLIEIFNVDDFEAKGDGMKDDTQAFNKAWEKVCSSTATARAVLLVPDRRMYLLKPITFSGPCKSSAITVQIGGVLLASDDGSDYTNTRIHWLLFINIKNLLVQGGGTIDGNGEIWWKHSCKVDKKQPCKSAPTAIVFNNCNNLTLRNFKVQNAQQMHMVIEKCTNVKASGLTVTAPEKSPNTDGIHVTGTKDILITDSAIGTGDDCISIVNATQKLRAMNITCGPGHGISIGSLGSKNSKSYVSDIIINGATFSGTTNGVRIKTWQGGSGAASKIRFQNLVMQNVANPIIIDQYYCDQKKPCKEEASAVQVTDVKYQQISGTSATHNAVVFHCSKTVPCQGIVMENVKLLSEDGKKAKASCNNVKIKRVGSVSPSCLPKVVT